MQVLRKEITAQIKPQR